jgi:hypothetical protein
LNFLILSKYHIVRCYAKVADASFSGRYEPGDGIGHGAAKIHRPTEPPERK